MNENQKNMTYDNGINSINADNVQDNNQNNMTYDNGINNVKSNNDDKYNIISLILGIISIIFSIRFSFFTIIIAIVGLILGIKSKTKNKKRIVAIILNVLGIMLPIILFTLGMILIILGVTSGYFNGLINYSSVEGKWNCKSFDGSGVGDNYIVTMNLKNDKTFSWNKYEDEKNNHVYGNYIYEDLKKANNSNTYKYYKVTLDGNEYVINGETRNEDYESTYEMGIKSDGKEAILMNVSTYNMYYCYLDK